jgi:phosphatidylinositol alpha-mannosyltransferase
MSLKIAITSPFGWPYVRRGNRFVHELSTYMANRGHKVHFITSKPGDISRKKRRRKVLEKQQRLYSHPFLSVLNIETWETFSIGCFRSLVQENYDIVQTIWPPDAFAASIYKSLKGTPFVHLLVDSNHFHRPTTFGKPMLRRVLKNAACLEVPSKYVYEELKRQHGLKGEMIPMPVNMDQFSPLNNNKFHQPRILCTSSFLDARKRVYLLVQAFELLLKEVPNAILQLSGHGAMNQEAASRLLNLVKPSTRRSIAILDVGKLEDLPELYSQAAVTVLPSLREAFGMVIMESLASGTPVVGTNSGAIPEVLNSQGVGVLFEPKGNHQDLCIALSEALELAQDPQTSLRCRQHAAPYSWEKLGPLYEALYLKVLNGYKPDFDHAKK